MTISYPLTPPTTPAPMSVEWSPLSAGGVASSPATFVADKFLHSGRKLEAALAYPAMLRAKGDAWAAFLAALDNSYGNFYFGPQGPGATPKGVATGTPLVKGAGQSGQTLLTDGWTPTTTGILKAGDWIQLGSGATRSLHMQLEDTNADGSGNATLTLWPAPRTAPADNSAIVVSSPKGVFRLKNRPQWAIGPAYIYEPLHLEIEEDF
jgi:hypothetical protein